MNRYLGKWFRLIFNDRTVRAKCVDIQFDEELSPKIGPIFYMRSAYGNEFRLTRQELQEHAAQN
jgi:hypothetical protein